MDERALVEALPELIARRADVALGLATALTLLLMALVWWVSREWAPQLWRRSVQVWNALHGSTAGQLFRRTPLVAPVMRRALSSARYLGLYAIVAFAVALTGLSIFLEIAEAVGADAALARFDVALSAAMREHLSAELFALFAAATHLGDPAFLGALGAFVAIGLAFARRFALALVWVIATLGGGLLTRLLKALFQRERPLHEAGLLEHHTFSFPSGHASGAMLVYGLLCYLIARHAPPAWRLPIALCGAFLIVVVGASRIFLQVHYFSDVLAGFASAGTWVALCIAGLEAVRWRERSRVDANTLA